MHPFLFFFHFLFLLTAMGAYWAAGRFDRVIYDGRAAHYDGSTRHNRDGGDGR